MSPLPGPASARDDRLERLLESLEEGVWERDLLSGRAWYSPRFKHLLGFASGDLPDDPSVVRLRVHPADLAQVDAAHAAAALDGRGASLTLRLLVRDGQWRWFRERLRVWPDEHGRPTRLVGTLLDLDDQQRAHDELERMTARFERAIAASDEGLFEAVWDQDDVQLSARARELVGLPPDTGPASYVALRARIHPDDVERVRAEVAAAALANGRWQVVYRARRFDQPDRYQWFRERGTAHRDAAGALRVSGMLADVHDQVTSTERLEARVARRTAELADALKQADAQRLAAEGANRAKASFLGQMSHELRTPLNGVLGMLQLAQRTAESAEQRRCLQLAQQAGNSLLRLVDDILDFARAEAGKLTLRDEPFDLESLLAETMRSFAPAIAARGVHALFDYQGPVCTLGGDPGRLRQVVSNLVSNAAKFTEAGSVQLVAAVGDLDAQGRRRVTLEVRDTGPGMDAETAQRVFEPFEQADLSIARRHGGTGLGLPIVSMLVALMGGHVEVETSPGAGSTFRVVLDLRQVAPPADEARLAPGHALLVQRDAMPAAWATRRLARDGWTAETVASIADAIVRLDAPGAETPQLVLIGESALSGDDDFEGLRQRLAGEVPVVLLVRPDFSAPALVSRAEVHGVQLVFAPLTRRELRQILHAPVQAATVEPAPRAAEPPAPAGPRVLVVEDNALNRLIAHEMLGAMGAQALLAESGEAALELCETATPDLVLMDIQMPGLDGLETARRLRRLQAGGRLPAFPIVALTAHAMPGDREASLQAGMDDHLTKPIQFPELQAVVDRYARAGG
jgi:signal transduction histidine kinase/CheY-like chemotaxis protein